MHCADCIVVKGDGARVEGEGLGLVKYVFSTEVEVGVVEGYVGVDYVVVQGDFAGFVKAVSGVSIIESVILLLEIANW